MSRTFKVELPAKFLVVAVDDGAPRDEAIRLMIRQVSDFIRMNVEEVKEKPAGVSQSAEEAGREPVQ